jgi:ABC-2 type transport system permease protein
VLTQPEQMTALEAVRPAHHLAITLATTRRILVQLRHDHRTVGLLIGVPTLLMILLRYVFDQPVAFDRIGPMLLCIFPFVVMFIVTSVATLRERTSGTLERLMTTPLGKVDLLFGYALAFGLVALAQIGVVLTISLTWLGLDVRGPLWALVLLSVLDALLGMALGLFASAFARTEFQAVQFMPAFVLPQVLLCGLIVPRDQMSQLLEWVSEALPLSYAVEAMQELTRNTDLTGTLIRDIVVIAVCALLALLLGAVTLPRRTP